MDQKTRKFMRMHKTLDPSDDVDRLGWLVGYFFFLAYQP